jgi:ribonuclease VapC
MIVVDSSAVIAIMESEPTAKALTRALLAKEPRYCSAVSYVESGVVLAGSKKRSDRAPSELDDFLRHFSIDIVPVDAALARRALDARIRYGKGFGHPANLNFGDSFSYALATSLKAPLLFVALISP